MPFNQWLIYKIPTLTLGAIIVSAAIIMSIAGLIIVRRLVPHHRLKLHNDVAGPIFSTLGVVYAVLLAFVVIVVWQNFDKAQVNVEREANYLVDLYQDAEAFRPEFKNEVRKVLREYADTVVNEEWPAMQKGGWSDNTTKAVKKLFVLYSGYEPKTESEKAFFSESINKLNELGELRRLRLMEARTGVNELLWFVLVLGGVVTIIFTFIFGSENFNAQVVMAVLLAVLISLILFTVLALDFPFTGGISISSEPVKQLAAHCMVQ